VFRTPGQRYLISPVLLQLFEAVTHAQLPRRLIALLNDSPHTPVQLRTSAVHALGLYARGPRIAHTPPSSHWHSNAFLAKRVIVEAGGLPPLLALLSAPDAATSSSSSRSSSEGLRARALQALTALGEDNSEAVQLLHSSGFGAALVAVLVPASSGSTAQQQHQLQLTVAEARAAAQAFAVMCGHTHSEPGTGLAGRSQSELAPVAAVIAHLLGTAQDWCVLSYTCDALSQLLAAVPLCPLELLQAIAGSLERALSVPASSSSSSSSSSDGTSVKQRREAITALCSCLHTAAAPHAASRTDVCAALLPLVHTALTDSALRGSSAAAADARSQAAALLQTLVTAHPSVLTAAAVHRLAQPAVATIAEAASTEEALSAVEQVVLIMSASAEAARVLHAHRVVPALFALLRTACCGSSDTMEQSECDEALAAAAAGALCTVLAAGAALAISSSSNSSSVNPFIGDYDRSAIAALAEPLVAAVAARCSAAAAEVQRLAEAMLSAYAAAAAAACDAPTAAAVCSAAQELTAVLEQAAAQHRALQAADASAAGSTTPVRRAPFHAHDPSVSEQQQQQLQQQHRRNDSYGDEYGLPSTASLFGNSSSSSSSGAMNNSSSSSSGYTAAFFAQQGSASPSTAPTSPPLHSGAAAASSDVNSAAVEVITTALNFEGSVRTVLAVGGHWDELLRELLRHCSVTVGRSVQLLYLSADGRRHVPLCEQDDLRYGLCF
jgi:hypothetical protein